MEAAPELNATPPSPLRLWGFLLTAVGALLAGVASLLVWVTVGLTNAAVLNAAYHGTDLADGRLVLTGAVVMLIAVLGSRFVHTRNSRIVVAMLAITGGLLAAVVAIRFLVTAASRFPPVSSALVQVAAQVEKTTPEQIVARFGGFTTVSLAPWLALSGGLIGTAGGVLTLRWARRTVERAKDAEPDDAAAEPSVPDS
jgi:Tryptophan-associated transmembrane protein (Trp_oprn_chp)